ncbi:hypothetical protein D5086_031288 [Populus alba]|nr:pentatricopeptide repeat-containing protein At4g21190 [Populus alba]XP_034898872.1 pentatricopeptide repeat-containing protein At4g21190 [Populus alba]KAJ6960827.1 pentatricopeptide repeat-containing protein [Populus alba x Populus x berolinensis]
MLCLRYSLPLIPNRFQSFDTTRNTKSCVVVCAAKGPRPRYPRVWKTKRRIGTISKSAKLVDCIKGLSNVKEEVYGALDSFVAWELEFPLIAVKKALRALEEQQEWKRIIQVTKWMLSKGQGRTMGTYFTLMNALAEDGRLDEVEELWTKLFSQYLEGTPRMMFDKMISIYYKRDMHDQIFEIFADMEELGLRPSVSIVNMVGNVFQRLGMMDKYEKLKKKYPPPKWIYRYIKGKRIRVRAKNDNEVGDVNSVASGDEEASHDDELDGINDVASGDEEASLDNKLDGINDVASEDEEAFHNESEVGIRIDAGVDLRSAHDANEVGVETNLSSNDFSVEANSFLSECQNQDRFHWEHNQPSGVSNSS